MIETCTNPESTASPRHDGILAARGQEEDRAEAADAHLSSWAAASGISTKLAPKKFTNGLRGAAAKLDIAAGECVVSVPEALLITAESARRSDFGQALQELPLDDQNLLLLWLMVERHDSDSLHAPFWRALPQEFCSGLSFTEQEVELLRGMPAHQECLNAVRHVKASYEALQPMMATLLQAYPQLLQPRLFDWQAFLWVIQFWYSYAMRVQFADGTACEAVAPYACLLNHSAQPHVTEVGRLVNGRLELTAQRSLKAGEEALLSYGPFDNTHFMIFYGFVLPACPRDTIKLHFKVQNSDRAHKVQAALRRLSLPLDHRLGRNSSFDAALSCLRVLHASENQLDSLTSPQDLPAAKDDLVWHHLRTALSVEQASLAMVRKRNSGLPLTDSLPAALVDGYIVSQLDVVRALLAAAEQRKNGCA